MHTATMPTISGATDIYLIVGHPVVQVQAPALFNAVFARAGIHAVMVPMQIAPEQLLGFVASVFQAPNVRGLCATIPHKTALAEWVDDCSPMGRIAGAVNAVRRAEDGAIEGALYDGVGFVKGLDAPIIPVHLGGVWGSIFSFESGKYFWKLPKRARMNRCGLLFPRSTPQTSPTCLNRRALISVRRWQKHWTTCSIAK